MTVDLRTLLPSLMPKAIAWAEAQAQFIAEHGVALTDAQCALAKRVGIRNPERIRTAEVSQLQLPGQIVDCGYRPGASHKTYPQQPTKSRNT